MAKSDHDQRDELTFQFVNLEHPGYGTDLQVRRQVVHTSVACNTDRIVKTNVIESKNYVLPRTLKASPLMPNQRAARASTPLKMDALPVLPSVLTSPTSVLERAFSRGSLAFRTISINDPDNVIGRNVAELGLDLSSIMSFYRTISMIQAQDFDRQYGAVIPGVISWKQFYALVFTDPVMLTTAILLTARHQFAVLGREASVRGISDQILVAVALYAAYEIKHSDGARYHTHMNVLINGDLGRDQIQGFSSCVEVEFTNELLSIVHLGVPTATTPLSDCALMRRAFRECKDETLHTVPQALAHIALYSATPD
ncbi:hypothetical protein Q7P35_009780 [Cladosporium inversicolor]